MGIKEAHALVGTAGHTHKRKNIKALRFSPAYVQWGHGWHKHKHKHKRKTFCQSASTFYMSIISQLTQRGTERHKHTVL